MVGEVEVDSQKLSEERKNYYDKWHTFTKEEVAKAKSEAEEEKEVAAKALGHDPAAPKSEAQKEDQLKREALKEAKKQWENKKLSEASQKFEIKNLDGINRVFDSVKLKWKTVILFKDNKNCKLKIPNNLKHKLIKVFVEGCVNCEIDFETQLITQHIEVARCENCIFKIRETTSTVQLDICKDITVSYAEGFFKGDKVKMFHAGVEQLKVEAVIGGKTFDHDFTYLEALEKDKAEDNFDPQSEGKTPLEIQYVTQFLGGSIVSRRVIRDAGNLPSTKEELDEKDLSARTFIRDAEMKKDAGNEAFKERNYAQAGVFYTEALHTLERAQVGGVSTVPAEDDISYLLFSNRAFCWQKMGHHEKAEEDARKCVALKPDYCKGLFRLGLALHAQRKYFEAVPILGKALKLEPKNEQVKNALGFAELQMSKMMRQDD